MMRPLLSLLLFSIFCQLAPAQWLNLIELSGIVMNINNESLPGTHVILKNKGRGCVANYKGIFTIIVQPGDTLSFSSIGYQKSYLAIPDSLIKKHLALDIYLFSDTILLEEIKIFPWKTYAEFKNAVITLKLKEQKDIENARKNIALVKTQIIMNDAAVPNVNFRQVMQGYYEKTFIQGQYPSISIMNPFNWAKFFKALEDGTFRDSRDLRNVGNED